MTCIDAAAARPRTNRFVLAAIASLLTLGLAGCETSNSLFGGTGPAPGPVAAEPPKAAPAAAKTTIAIAPIIGAPDAVAKQLTTKLGETVQKHQVALAREKEDKSDFTLRGFIVAAKDKAGTKVSYIWDITDPAGRRVNRITGEEIVPGAAPKDPWTAVTPQVMQTITDKTAASLIAWLPSATGPGAAPPPVGTGVPTPPALTPPAATPVAASPPGGGTTTGSITRQDVTAVVVPVAGAPGDGAVALTSALQRELSRSGVSLIDKPTPAAYRVEGKVTLGQPKDGKQAIQIDWRVRDPQGRSVGTVSQKNEIPQGSLDGAWGKTADAAAAAASQGILRLLPQAKASN